MENFEQRFERLKPHILLRVNKFIDEGSINNSDLLRLPDNEFEEAVKKIKNINAQTASGTSLPSLCPINCSDDEAIEHLSHPWTLLINAINRNRFEKIRILVKYGAKLDYCLENDKPAFMYMSYLNHDTNEHDFRIIKFCIDNGVNLNGYKCSLITSAIWDHAPLEFIKELIANGCDFKFKDPEGLQPIHYCLLHTYYQQSFDTFNYLLSLQPEIKKDILEFIYSKFDNILSKYFTKSNDVFEKFGYDFFKGRSRIKDIVLYIQILDPEFESIPKDLPSYYYRFNRLKKESIHRDHISIVKEMTDKEIVEFLRRDLIFKLKKIKRKD